MCGVAGVFRPGGHRGSALIDCVAAMTATLAHRGPDRGDTWADPEGRICLGHRRLSILDLSAAGAQPMHSDCGRFSVTFNGEIYNHLEIRGELEACGGAPRWIGSSDTETLLYAIRHWGIEGALKRFNGMFAFGLWDARDRTLTLCRDRFGEKPLFYGWIGQDFVFASELKAFSPHPKWHPTIDRRAMTAFMRYAYVPAPWTIWEGFRKLVPGSFITVASGAHAGEIIQPRSYWSMRDCVVKGQQQRLNDPVAAADELERLLSLATKRQLLSDVPLGAFLSGGIDSSTIVALMQSQSSRPVKTFSIGFAEAGFNEADHARRVARHLTTDHTEMIVSPSDARDVIPRLVEMSDEPFADSSQIPTLLVAMLARRSVTVSLSGDGGDELFGGYNRHVWGSRLQARFGSLPGPARRLLGGILGAIAPEPANMLSAVVGRILPARYRVLRAGDQIVKVVRVLGTHSFDEMYRRLSSIEDNPAAVIVGGAEPLSWFNDQMHEIEEPLDPLDRMTLSDALSYLSDDILQKVDRAAMSVGLETRVPFLDKDVAEFSCRLPPDMKVKEGRGKWIVREVLNRHVPDKLTVRPKTGFSLPLDDWLRGPLRPWASDLLSPDRLERQGLFNSELVTRIWHEHLHTSRNHGFWLWNVLMAQGWADRWHGVAR
ncbi:asparagine synthase (glutamine-hydrolyzing) [Bradyrhizobium sp. AUGA SZCCT0158]|uniref:asparagine synthase (glutamine-hydrolyzing) n=1 Tax=Bradyrhizobium sp. AUGA SZCCT0158 TaxID=2807661 RepID=UPI001BA4E006|nr:asparagine synthase (glutamine-hydrolyzing) [Bradyrhizobium sp. AUGA SZCCT0158]MBR1199516.1 asparagine synthase (glutamine-hydrolyzing) [Bradyrhizobium sp. AUGA SZCCT0158]